MANEYNFQAGQSSDFADVDGGFFNSGILFVGNDSVGSVTNAFFRAVNVTIPQGTTIVEADLFYYVDQNGSDGDTVKMTVYGMAEDNTSTFGSDPGGRPNTTATYSYNRSVFVGQYFGMDITNIVQEIVNRSGWVSGNAMGFKILDNGSALHHRARDLYSGGGATDTYLYVLLTAQPNFYPSPTTVTVPTDTTTPSNWGIKVAKKGNDVLKATDEELIMSTKFPMLKSNQHDLITGISPSSTSTVTHNLGYKSAFLAYGTDSNGNRVKFPSSPLLSDPPITAFNSNVNLKITNGSSSNTTNVYYYIFIDDINL